MPGWVGWPELLVLVVVLLLIFGPKRLPEMGRSVGKGLREFKDSITGRHDEQAAEPAHPELTPADAAAGFCSSCGSTLTSEMRFCAKCGAAVPQADFDAVTTPDAASVERDS